MTIKLSNSKKVKNFPENVVSRYYDKFNIFYARNVHNNQKEKYYNREKKYRAKNTTSVEFTHVFSSRS